MKQIRVLYITIVQNSRKKIFSMGTFQSPDPILFKNKTYI
jgi:hypothetical protein